MEFLEMFYSIFSIEKKPSFECNEPNTNGQLPQKNDGASIPGNNARIRRRAPIMQRENWVTTGYLPGNYGKQL